MKKYIFLLILVTTTVFADTIKSLSFRGLVYLSSETAKDMINLNVGDTINIEKVDNAIRVLFEQNYFEDIWVDENNGHLTINVLEKPTISKVVIEGVGDNDKTSIDMFLRLKKGEMFDHKKSELSKEDLKKFFEIKGFFDTVVDIETTSLNEKSVEVLVKINRGENIIIRDVTLHGSKEIGYNDIESSIQNKKRERAGWLWGRNDGKLKVLEIERDPSRIQDAYYKYGYLDANVSTPYLRVYLDNYDAKLEYKVEEGRRYRVNNIVIDIPDELIDTKKVIKNFLLQSGDMFDVTKLRRDSKVLENLIADMGYAYVRVTPDVKKVEENYTAEVVYTVVPGDKVRIRDVKILGNSVTIDRVIRRDIFLAPGDLYSKTELSETTSAIRRTGYFEDVSIKEQRVDRYTIDLIVEVKETQTGTIGGGIGYGSSDGFLINAYLSEANIFGSGVRASVDVERSDKELSGSISLSNPRIFDSKYSLAGSIYRKDYDYYDYDTITTGVTLTVGRKIGRYTSIYLKYILENAEYDNIDSTLLDSKYARNLEDSIKSSLVPSITFNNTDDYFLPRRGISASTSFEFAGAGGDQEFLKSITKFSIFHGLEDSFGYDLILRYKAQFGYMDLSGYTPYNEKLYLGGVSSLRGYESNSIGPKNENGALTGGTMYFANSVEASFPLVERIKMRGAIFFDYGMIGEDGFDEKRASTGVAIEWISPLGPISLIFAKALEEKSGDRTSAFEFTMGRQF